MIPLSTVKAALHVVHDLDDDDLERRIASATAEALQYMGRNELPCEQIDVTSLSSSSSECVSSGEPAADVVDAIILLVQAGYEGDPTTYQQWRWAAETKLTPHRCGMGV